MAFHSGLRGSYGHDHPGWYYDGDGGEGENSNDDAASVLHPGDRDVPDPYDEERELRATGFFPRREFRTRPCGSTFNPVLFNMARAAGRMPHLQCLSLEINQEIDSSSDQNLSSFELEFVAPGCHAWGDGFDENGVFVSREDRDESWLRSRSRVYVETGPTLKWEEPPGWREMWKASMGTDLLVRVMSREWE
ncbi:MAG: hypothetical protein M1816_007562 [Peltula sp. TS41687]|nr:MAG: hypothetical protein M1816_007562 [Peltula sp. TS41687]